MALFRNACFLISFFTLLPADLGAQATTILDEYRAAFLRLSDSASQDPGRVHVQIVLIDPGPTITTVFGHVAIRVARRWNQPEEDFYIDFGNYDESISFVRKLLSGSATFYTRAIPTVVAVESWAKSGRRVRVYELSMTAPQKLRFLDKLRAVIRETEPGYDYHNFRQNCVTYIRDLLSYAYAEPIALNEASMADGKTWRQRVHRYSRQIGWLQIGENYLFNYVTDQPRNGHDIIYLPQDLVDALRTSGRLAHEREVLPDIWKVDLNKTDVGGWAFILALLIGFAGLLSRGRFEYQARVLSAVFAGFVGTLVWVVSLGTSYDFMSKNVLMLVFWPSDFFMASTSMLIKWRAQFRTFVLFRLLLVVIAIAIAIMVPQKSMTALALGLILWTCLAIAVFRGKNEA